MGTRKTPGFRKNDKEGEWKYITGIFIDGRFAPMGFSKNLAYAQEMVKLHKHVLCELKLGVSGVD